MKIVDFNHPFFDHLWRRLTIIVACFGWSVLEFHHDAPIWGIVFGGLGLYLIYGFFFIRSGITKTKVRKL